MKKVIIIFSIIALAASGCKQTDSFTNFATYFNIYYNLERIDKECQSEFEYQTENLRIEPRIFIPVSDLSIGEDNKRGMPPFLRGFIISQQQRQPVISKIDSMLVKGSKILALRPNSTYIEGSLFYMARAYFYKNEWLPSQIKCSELIDKYPAGEFSPDAHLLYSINLLIQRKFYAGEIMLSRTVDIAWQLKRYDILSEAFRLQAELAIYQNDLQKAVRPYKQAVAQSNDGGLKARWQIELAALLFRQGFYERAEREFDKARDYSPDYQAEFESYLYQAASLARLGEYELADDIFSDLEGDGKYQEWKPHVFGQRLNMRRVQLRDSSYVGDFAMSDLDSMETLADSIYVNHAAIISYYYQRAVDFYYDNQYEDARRYFARSRVVNTPAQMSADRMYNLLNIWVSRSSYTNRYREFEANGSKIDDSVRRQTADYFYDIARVHERLGNEDSVKIYYGYAAETSIPSDSISAKYYYNYARVLRDDDRFASDSLMEIVIANHPLSPFGAEAIDELGYTDNFIIDTVADLMSSGNKLMKHGDYYYAIDQYKRVYQNFAEHEAAPKALYTIGWIYEIHLVERDTSLMYYQLLIDKYPDSEYAKELRLSVDYKIALESGEELPDSLKKRDFIPTNRPDYNKMKPPLDPRLNPNFRSADQINAKDLIDNPGSILDSPKNLLQNPENMIQKGFSVPTSLEGLKNAVKLPTKIDGIRRADDSTSQGTDPIPENKENKNE